jgi:ferredoxin
MTAPQWENIMNFFLRTCIGVVFCQVAAAPLRADFESDLLEKFQNQNQQAVRRLKQELENQLAKAAALCPVEPEKTLDLLQQTQQILHEESKLSKDDRADFSQRIKERLHEARERIKSKVEAAKAATPTVVSAYKTPQSLTQVSQPIFVPVLTQVPVQSSLQVTPVVSADRRFVRIGVSGSFAMPTLGPLVPIQIPVPTILQGPGNAITVLP